MTSFQYFFLGFSFLFGSINAGEYDIVLHRFDVQSDVKSLALTNDGNKLAVGGSDKTVYLYDYKTKELIKEVGRFHHDVNCLVFSSDETFLYAGSNDRTIKKFDLGAGKYSLFRGHSTLIWSLDLSPDDQLLVAGTLEDRTRIWDVNEERIAHELVGHERTASVMAVAYSSDGQYIATGSADMTIKIWDGVTYELINTLHGHGEIIYDLQFTPDNRYLISCSRDHTVRLWNVQRGEIVRIMKGHRQDVVSIDVSPNGRYCLSASLDKTIVLWNLMDGKELYTYTSHENKINQVLYHPSGDQFLSAADGGEFWLWEVSERIFVDKYLKDSVDTKIAQERIFRPKRDDEKRSEYRERQEKQEVRKEQIYNTLYQKYLDMMHNSYYEESVESKVKIYYE